MSEGTPGMVSKTINPDACRDRRHRDGLQMMFKPQENPFLVYLSGEHNQNSRPSKHFHESPSDQFVQPRIKYRSLHSFSSRNLFEHFLAVEVAIQ